MLTWRIENPLCKFSACAQGFGDKDHVSYHDFVPQSSVKLPYVEKLPPYTTWIFLDKYDGVLCLFSYTHYGFGAIYIIILLEEFMRFDMHSTGIKEWLMINQWLEGEEFTMTNMVVKR